MKSRQVAVCVSLVVVAAVYPARGFAGQKSTPSSSPTRRSSSSFSSGGSFSSSSKPASPVPHDKPLTNFLKPQQPGSPGKLQGQKGILTPNFNAQVHNNLPPSTYKIPPRNGGKAGSQQAKIDNPLPFGGPKAVTAREKDKTVRANPSSNGSQNLRR